MRIILLSGVSDIKSIERSLPGLNGLGNPMDLGSRWTFMTPSHELFNLFRRTLRHDLDRAVRSIPDPAGHAKR